MVVDGIGKRHYHGVEPVALLHLAVGMVAGRSVYREFCQVLQVSAVAAYCLVRKHIGHGLHHAPHCS